jgi:transposase-like protein
MELENRLFDVSKVEEKLKSIKSLSDLTGPNGVIQEIIKSTVERILRAEQEAHLGFEPHEMTVTPKDNYRNGYKKTIKTSSREVELDIPRDRKGTFEPQFIQKHQSNEVAHFWQAVLTDLKARGVKDILIACIDGLKGFPDAIAAVFPKTMTQLCIVHQIRTALRYMASKHHKEFVRDMKEVYRASNIENAEVALKNMTSKWGSQYPMAV